MKIRNAYSVITGSLFTVLLILAFSADGLAQANTFPSTGNVGIGTITPKAGLEIGRSSTWSSNHWQRNLILGGNAAGSSAAMQFGTGSGLRWGMGSSTFGFCLWSTTTDDTSAAASYKLSINAYGQVGINTLYQGSMLAVGPAVTGGNLGSYDVQLVYGGGIYSATSSTPGFNAKIIPFTGTGNTEYRNYYYTGSHIFYTSGGSNNAQVEAMRIVPSGNILIGKGSQQNTSYKLDVNGNVRANKVVVNTTGADFVFGAGYQLPSLDSLNRYIQSHHHLPGVSSAEEMKLRGQDVGQMQTLLLQKVEELTRYILEIDQRMQQLELINKRLTNQIESYQKNHKDVGLKRD